MVKNVERKRPKAAGVREAVWWSPAWHIAQLEKKRVYGLSLRERDLSKDLVNNIRPQMGEPAIN